MPLALELCGLLTLHGRSESLLLSSTAWASWIGGLSEQLIPRTMIDHWIIDTILIAIKAIDQELASGDSSFIHKKCDQF